MATETEIKPCESCSKFPYCGKATERMAGRFSCGEVENASIPVVFSEKAKTAIRTAWGFLKLDVCFYLNEASKQETDAEAKRRIETLIVEAETLLERMMNEINR